MTVNAGDIVRATAEVLLPDAGVAQNVYHYKAGAGVSDSDAAVMDSLRTFIDAAHAALNTIIDADVIPTNISYQLSTDNGVTYNDIGERGWVTFVPSSIGDSSAPQNALLAHFGAIGIGRLGSKYIGGFTKQNQANGIIQGAAFLALTNYVNQVIVQPPVAGGVMQNGWVEKNTGIFRIYNNTATIPINVASQRRRKAGVGI